ncbi:MAG: SUMF1/EgtB/PvdO family nonheme iron enzyme [Synechococcales cyanobacterium K44_A2020_017]|nr:SUMF1/EgtB/PvdO family nonheme iron enzyme [Synechococcales cyanobacterium K32_A2020_035]MBF2094501.1 SUMF1/EgtB/PvdO family nonheme iron enzyme [Synechococcales cyanobacterium K44_A2020_017]
MNRNWAICIGINDYYNLQPLQYAVQDAIAVQDFFLTTVKFEQVFYFADDSPPIPTPRGEMRSLPTFGNLKRFFRERFQQPFLEAGDNFWFFFAGHGELHEGHDYLMPIDVDPGNIAETALRVSDVTACLRNCGADNTILLLDACRSQGRRQGTGLGTDEQQGMVTIYSCSPREASYELEALGHGSFTHALLEGLMLQGANNCATVERLNLYLRYQVPSLNARYGKPKQTPYTAVEPLSKNYLILLPEQATVQDVLTLKSEAQDAELNGQLDLAKQLWIRVLGASRADLQAITALERIALKRVRELSSPKPTPSVAGQRSQERASTPVVEFEVATLEITPGFFGLGAKLVRQTRQGRAEYRRESLGQEVTLDLMLIPSGTFTMGSPDGEGYKDEKPQHSVTISSFWMGKYPVTQSQWRTVSALPKIERDLDADPASFKGDHRPVEQVSWHDAVEFCQRLSKHTGREYRLPSEAEWEYACRSGTTTPFHVGPTIITELANYNGNDTYSNGLKGIYSEQTTEVGSFPANAFGLYDMHGNVWEWCLDHWHDTYQGSSTDGSAWVTGGDNARRVLRGGSWDSYPWHCRSAYRHWYGPGGRDFLFFGFRVVVSSVWALS